MGASKKLFIKDREAESIDVKLWMMSYNNERDRRISLEKENKQLKQQLKQKNNDKKN